MRKRVELKSPVRENRTPGSVRGPLGNWRSYRDGAHRMLRLDHIPFYGRSTSNPRSSFSRLGFHVSPAGRYSSPQYPERLWKNHCVFLRDNWFDLIDSTGESATQTAPGACLLRANDLLATTKELGDLLVQGSRYELVRHWDEDQFLPPERFELASLSWKIGRLPVAIIQHAYPCPDTRREWFDHPNGASGIAGVTVCSDHSTEVPSKLAKLADLSWLTFVDAVAFRKRFEFDLSIAITVRVRSLATAAEILSRNQVTFYNRGNSITLTRAEEVACSWEFIE